MVVGACSVMLTAKVAGWQFDIAAVHERFVSALADTGVLCMAVILVVELADLSPLPKRLSFLGRGGLLLLLLLLRLLLFPAAGGFYNWICCSRFRQL